jgi:hypothetical protein
MKHILAGAIFLLVSMTAGLSSGLPQAQARPVVLDNGLLRAEFGGSGLTELRDIARRRRRTGSEIFFRVVGRYP